MHLIKMHMPFLILNYTKTLNMIYIKLKNEKIIYFYEIIYICLIQKLNYGVKFPIIIHTP